MYMSEKSNDNSKEISRNIELVTKCDLWKNKYDSENFQVSTYPFWDLALCPLLKYYSPTVAHGKTFIYDSCIL